MRLLQLLLVGIFCVCCLVGTAMPDSAAKSLLSAMNPAKVKTMTTEGVVALLSDRRPLVRGLAARELGERHATEALSALRGLLSDELPAVRGEAAASLLALGDETGKPLLHDLLKTGTPETALRAAAALARSGNDGGIELAKTYIKSPYFTTRECAIEALAASKDEATAYSGLEAGLKDANADVRIRTLSLLGQRGTNRSLDLITTLLTSKDAGERRMAVIAVVDTQLWDGVPLLIGRLSDDNQQVREAASYWLKAESGSGSPTGAVRTTEDALRTQSAWTTWWVQNKSRFPVGSKTPVKRSPPHGYLLSM